MLAGSTHGHKVNFCKFTNETRNGIEDATAHSGQTWIAAVNGTAAGGGYELALACDEILLVDDRSSAVSLPEVPLLAVLPGTGGPHPRRRQAPRPARPRRRVRHPQRGRQGAAGGGVGARRRRRPAQRVRRARPAAGAGPGRGVGPPRRRSRRGAHPAAPHRRRRRHALRARHGRARPGDRRGVDHRRRPDRVAAGVGRRAGRRRRDAWVLATVRELDDAILRLRFDEPELGTWVLRTTGDADAVAAAEAVLAERPLAGPRGPAVLGAHAQAPRRLGPHARRPGRAGQLLRRHARRAGPRRRPHADARRARGRTPRIRRRRRRCGSRPPTTAGTRCRTA